MEDETITPEEFGQKIKAKYPQYKDVPDAELAQKIVAKYPQYKSQVDFSGKKKEESASPSQQSNSASVGAPANSSATAGLENDAFKQPNPFVGSPQQSIARRESAVYQNFKQAEQVDPDKQKEIAADVEAEANNTGIWNNIKQFGKKALNKISDSVFAMTDEGSAPEEIKIETDPLKKEKDQAKTELLKQAELAKIKKQPVPEINNETIAVKAKQIAIDKRIKSQSDSQVRSFLEDLPDNDKSDLTSFAAKQYKTIDSKQKLLLGKQDVLRGEIDNSLATITDLNKEISKFENPSQIPQEFKDQYQQEYVKYQSLLKDALGAHQEYVSQEKNLGEFSENLDVFKRDYGWMRRFYGNLDNALGQIATGTLGAIDYGVNVKSKLLGSDPLGAQVSGMAKEGVNSIQNAQEKEMNTIAKPINVENINNLNDFGHWLSETVVAQQIPIYAMVATGSPGIAGIGITSTGQKFEDMQQEMQSGQQDYSTAQQIGIPLGYGAAETASAVVDHVVLSNASRVIRSATAPERSMIAEGMWSGIKNTAKETIKGGIYEGIDESGTQIAENMLDKYAGGKKNVSLLDGVKDAGTAGAVMGMMIPFSAGVVSEAVKPFSVDTKIQKANAEIISLQKQLDNSEISDRSRDIIQTQLDNSKDKAKELLSKKVGDISKMKESHFNEVLRLEKEQANIRSNAKEILLDEAIPEYVKKQLTSNLKEAFDANENRRVDLIERGSNKEFDRLEEEDQISMMDQAQRQLMREKNPDGTKNVTLTDDEIKKRAGEIVVEKKAKDEAKENTLKNESAQTESTNVNAGVRPIAASMEQNRTAEQPDTVSENIQPAADGKTTGKNISSSRKEVVVGKGTFTVTTNSEGDQKFYRKDGSEIPEYTTRKLKSGELKRVKNPLYSSVDAAANETKTENQLKNERKKEFQEASDNFVPANPQEAVDMAIANGLKISRASLEKETGEKAKNMTWLTGMEKESGLQSVESAAEQLAQDNPHIGKDDSYYRDALIESANSGKSREEFRDRIIDNHKKAKDASFGISEEEAKHYDFMDNYATGNDFMDDNQLSVKDQEEIVESIGRVFNASRDYTAVDQSKEKFKEGVKAGRDKTKERAKQIAEALKIYTEKGVLSARQASILTQRALKTNFNNRSSVKTFEDYAYKVMRNADYKDMLDQGNRTKRLLKKAIAVKANPKSAITVDAVKSFLQINPANVDDINEYNEIAKTVSDNLKGIKADKNGNVSNENLEMSNNTIRLYTQEQLKLQEAKTKDKLLEDYEDMVAAGVIDPDKMSLQEMQEIVEAVNEGDKAVDSFTTQAENLSAKEAVIRKVVDSKLKGFSEQLKEQTSVLGAGTADSLLSPTEQNIVGQIQSIDTSELGLKDLTKLNSVIDNILVNNDFSGSGDIEVLSDYQKSRDELKNIIDKSGIELAKLSDGFVNSLRSVNQIPEFITKSTKVAAQVQNLTGISDVFNGHAKAKIEQNRTIKAYNDLKSKLGKEIDNAENRYRRGVYSRVIQHFGGTEIDQQNEFNRIKGWVKQTAERLTSLDEVEFPREVKEGKLVNKIYKELLDGTNNAEEVKSKLEKVSLGNIKLVDFWIKKHDAHSERLFENAEIYNNKLLEQVVNYTATSVKGVDGKSVVENSAARDIFEQNFFSKKVDEKSAGAKNNRTKAKNLASNAVLDLDFDNVQSKKYYESTYDIETNKAIAKVRRAFADPEMEKILGGRQNLKIMENSVRQSVLAQKNRLPIPTNSERQLEQSINILQAKGARIALGSVTQVAKQYFSVAANALVNLGGESPLYFKALSVGNKIELFNVANIGLRGETKAGYNRKVDFNEIDKVDFSGDVKQGLNKAQEIATKVSEKIMKPLERADVAVARTSWLAFYMRSLKKQGINVDSIDWSKEHEKPNKEAMAYAEQEVSRNQAPNDASSGPSAFKDPNVWARIVKNVALPFSSFALNQRIRMTNDIQKLIYGGEKAEAAKSLAATLAEQAVFNGIKVFVINSLTTAAGNGILSLFGYNDDDNEIVDKDKWRKYVAALWSDYFYSGMGSLTQEVLQGGTNKFTKLALGEEFFYNYDPTKDGEPWWLRGGGIYSTPLVAGYNTFDDIQYLDGITGKFNGAHNDFKDVEMTNKEKNISKLIFVVDLMNVSGISDAALNQINGKVKRKFKDQLIEENGNPDKIIHVKSGPKDQKSPKELDLMNVIDVFKKTNGKKYFEKPMYKKLINDLSTYKYGKHKKEEKKDADEE